jgi:hypothetical protein
LSISYQPGACRTGSGLFSVPGVYFLMKSRIPNW